MSISKALAIVKRCTCAIGYLAKSIDEIPQDSEPPAFKILGSGFLIGPRMVITNRHVIVALQDMTRKYRLPQDRRVIQFTNGRTQVFLKIEGEGYIADPMDKARSDIGFLSFPFGANLSEHNLEVATVDEEIGCEVGDEIGVYGYAYGEKLHLREAGEKEKVYRFGPVLQQGFISGMAPFDSAEYIERLLLDVRTAKGMSGAPVFDSTTGTIVGIHSSGIGADVAFAIPINKPLVSTIIDIINGPSVASGSFNHPIAQRKDRKI